MSVKLGMEAKLYRNTGTYDVPVWVEVTNLRDATVSVEKGEADVTTRANSGWRATLPTLKDLTIEFEMVWDTADEGFEAVRAAFFGDTTLEILALDGAEGVSGSKGIRATMGVTNFSRSEPLEEAITVAVTLKAAYSEHPPEWYEET